MAVSPVSSDLRPLQIMSGKLHADDWQRIRAAKASLDLPFLITPAKAVPGGVGRVLAIGVKPDFVCDYAFVPDTKSPGLIAAMEWALTDKEDPRAVTVEDMMKQIFGPETKEITNAEDVRGSDPRLDDEGPYREHFRDAKPEPGSVIAGRQALQ